MGRETDPNERAPEGAEKFAASDPALDQLDFTLGAAQFEAFRVFLDAPAAPNPKLKLLIDTPAPWDA